MSLLNVLLSISIRGGRIYTCCTDTRDRDQSDIKRSSCKIGDDQDVRLIKVKMGPILRLHPRPTHHQLAIKDQGPFSGAIKRSRSKNGPDQILIPVVGVSTAGIGGFEFALDGMLNVRASDVNDRKSAGKRGSSMYHTHLWER